MKGETKNLIIIVTNLNKCLLVIDKTIKPPQPKNKIKSEHEGERLKHYQST
jgi:hypothetical protein